MRAKVRYGSVAENDSVEIRESAFVGRMGLPGRTVIRRLPVAGYAVKAVRPG